MGRGFDIFRRVNGPICALTQYEVRDVGDASINFTYSWSEEVVSYFRNQPDDAEFDLVV